MKQSVYKNNLIFIKYFCYFKKLHVISGNKRMIKKAVKVFNIHNVVLAMSLSVGLASCGGGGSDPAPQVTPTQPPIVGPTSQDVSGGGVKGPLANAVVTVYAFDATQPGFKGSVVTTATTDASAAITGLSLPLPLNPPYIMEFTSEAGTTDITTGVFPVISTMRTVVTQAMLDSGSLIYATPLTSMAVDIAVTNVADTNGTAGIQSDEFEAALANAASQVVSTLGFGLDSSVDIFDTPPLINDSTVTTDAQADVAAYRTAVEAITAIAYQISEQSSGASTDTVLADLAADLSDGAIDGSAGTTLDVNTLQVLEQDPATLPIPNTTQTVADVQSILAAETATTGSTSSTTDLTDGTISTVAQVAETDPDADGDGVLNADDAFPEDGTESVDTDGDGIGDVADPDDDNNGILDVDEGVTPVPTATDSDGDGFDDGADNCPSDFNPAQTDTDADTDGDACDTDDDNDGVDDAADAFPLDINESVDTDSDGLGDSLADADDDNDGVLDVDDAGTSPLDGSTACAVLIDCDGDGVLDGADFDPVDAAVTINFAPVVTDDAVTVTEDAALFVIDVVANDTDDDGNPNDTVSLDSIGANDAGLGAAVINGNSIDYTPVANAHGVDTFSYTVTDGDVTTDGVVTVTITAKNDDPVITQSSPIAVVMDEDGAPAAFVAPVIDASDVEADALTWSLSSAATSGVATVSGNGASPTVTYVPDVNYNGPDSFEATVTDSKGGSAAITIDVTVDAVNDVPVFVAAGPFSIAEDAIDAAVVGSVTATDVDTPVTGYDITSGNTGNAFAISPAGQITVATAAAIDFESASSFTLTVTATDGVGTSAGVDVIVNISNVNDVAPVVSAVGPFTIFEDAENLDIVGTVSATDADSAVTDYSITAGNIGNAFAISSAGQITVATAAAIDYETATSFTLTITATDGVTASAGVDVIVDINDVNDTAPVVAAAGPFNIAEDAPDATVVGSVNATDVDTVGSVTGYSITAGNTGSAFAISSAGEITVADTLAIDHEVTTSFNLTITATDSVNESVGVSVIVDINDINDTAPVVGAAGPFSVAEDSADTTSVGSVNATDADSAVTGYSISAGNTGNAFAISPAGQLTVADTNAIDYEVATSFTLTVTATDGVSTSSGVDVVVNINDVNDTAPVIGSGQSFNVISTADNGTVVGTVSATDADTVGGITGFSISGAVFDIDASGQITVADNASLAAGSPYTLSVDATDGVATSASESVTITVVNNAPPVIDQTGPLSVVMDEDEFPQVFVAPFISATDAEGDNLIWSTTGASHGLGEVFGTNVNSPSLISYTPDSDFSGDDSFVVNVSDGTTTVGITINITVNPSNDAPVTFDDNDTTAEDTPFTTVNVLTNDDDGDGPDALSIDSYDSISSSGGTIVSNGDGTFEYTPALNFNGFDDFSYTVTDGEDTAVGFVSIEVTAENDGPTAGADSASTTVDTAVTTASVLLNDTDVENDSLSVVAGDPTATNGTVVNNNDGTFTYTPNPGYTGSDSFNYTVTDSLLDAVGTVTVTVNPEGIAIAITTLMSLSEGGVAGLEDLGPDEYEYWTDNWDSVSGLFSFEDKAYNHSTGVFDSIAGGNELILSAGQWVVHGNIYGTDDGVGGLNVSIRDPADDNLELSSINLTARYVDLQGELIADYLDTVWQGAMIDSNAVFNSGAKLITEYRFEMLSESYSLWVDDWCENDGTTRYVDLNGNCDAVNVDVLVNSTGYAQALSEVVAISEWVDPDDYSTPPGAIGIAWEGSTTLMLQLVSAGVANYYVVDWSSADGASRVADAVAGTAWIQNSDPGVDMIQFQVPASFVSQFQGDLDEGLNYFLTVQNGFVRRGQKDTVGDVGFDNGIFNGNAMSDVLGNFSAPSLLDCNVTGDPYSFTDFEAVVTDCGVLPITAGDIEDQTFTFASGPGEQVTFNTGGTGSFSDDGGVTNEPIFWSITAEGYLDITDDLSTPTIRDMWVTYGVDPGTGGKMFKAYTEGDNPSMGDMIFDGVADGEIWEDIAIPAGGGTLTCLTESGWDDAANGGLGAPITPYSFVDYETVLADCGTVQTLTRSDVAGKVFDAGGGESDTFYDTGAAATLADPESGRFEDGGTEVIDFIWYIDNGYLVVYADSTIDADLDPGFEFRETQALIGISGNTYSFVNYAEQTNYSDMVRSTGTDGEIFNTTKTLVP